MIAAIAVSHGAEPRRWTEEKANEWYAAQQWPVGFDYVTASAINQIEMWQAESFDPATIELEMQRAQDLGFNTARIFLIDLVWEADPDGFKDRIDQFLTIADRHGIKAIVTFFTNGGKNFAPKLGKQPDSQQGVHNSQWIQSPGAEKVNNPECWPRLKAYVQDIVSRFANDPRILMWCLYNEPENHARKANSLPLMRQLFDWARDVNPTQPLSAPLWKRPGAPKSDLPIVAFLGENCDVMSFHCYEGPETMEAFIADMKQFNRPVICTEYMGRPKSTFKEILPILKREKVGAISWGLTAGKCNFHLQWSSKPGDPEPTVWFHDIYRLDGTPYSQEEVDFIKAMTSGR